MSTEELLRPRYKVVIKAPNCFKVGAIIEKHKYASGNWYVPNFMFDPDDYPDVFEPLQWFEEREKEEMPKYVKSKNGYHKVVNWKGSFQNVCWTGCDVADERIFIYSSELQPATLAEYEAYINQKENQ